MDTEIQYGYMEAFSYISKNQKMSSEKLRSVIDNCSEKSDLFGMMSGIGHIPAVTYLLDNYEIDINKEDGFALSSAITCHQDRMAKFLIAKGAQVNLVSFGEEVTPLGLAIKEDQGEILKTLIEKDLSLLFDHHARAFELIVDNDKQGILRLILALLQSSKSIKAISKKLNQSLVKYSIYSVLESKFNLASMMLSALTDKKLQSKSLSLATAELKKSEVSISNKEIIEDYIQSYCQKNKIELFKDIGNDDEVTNISIDQIKSAAKDNNIEDLKYFITNYNQGKMLNSIQISQIYKVLKPYDMVLILKSIMIEQSIQARKTDGSTP